MDGDGTEGQHSIVTQILPPDLTFHCWSRKCLFSRHHKYPTSTGNSYMFTYLQKFICSKTNKNLPIMFKQAFEFIIFIWNTILESDHTQCNVMISVFLLYYSTEIIPQYKDIIIHILAGNYWTKPNTCFFSLLTTSMLFAAREQWLIFLWPGLINSTWIYLLFCFTRNTSWKLFQSWEASKLNENCH